MLKKIKTKSDKKYPGLLDLFKNIKFDATINTDKISNMKKLMRKYNELPPGPTQATHIWYEEAKKYRAQVLILKASNERLKMENDMLKEK